MRVRKSGFKRQPGSRPAVHPASTVKKSHIRSTVKRTHRW